MKILFSGLTRRYFLISVLLSIILFQSRSVLAGGGPETTLIVVNSDSPLSMLVANYYRELRDIPSNHLIYLSDIPTSTPLKIDDFRRKILRPIHNYLVSENLLAHIDAIAYSADFPYAVDFSADAKREGVKLDKVTGKIGSITGLTYFFSQVSEGDLSYLSRFSHRYFREQPYRHPNLTDYTPITQQQADILNKARKLHKQKRFHQAVETLTPLSSDFSGAREVHYLLSKSLARIEDSENALNHLEAAIKLGWNNRLMIENDKDLQQLSHLPRFDSLLKTIYVPRVSLLPTRGFNSADSWRYVQKLPPSELKTGLPDRKAGNNVTEQKVSPFKTDYSRLQINHPKLVLSTMLAYTGIRGNSIEEVYSYLRRAADSDGTAPVGTVYLMTNRDVRTETRFPMFDNLIKDMGRLSRDVEIVPGTLPKARSDVMGLVAGSKRFNWEKSRSQFLPGAIAESLTSYAGHFATSEQTKLTEFLRRGAAGSSGAVREPYNLWEKFPSPYLHYHYAQGSSLSEAFYQSIASPYQLVIVGDPLTRPFARFSDIVVIEDLQSTPLKGIQSITPVATDPTYFVKKYELWIDGKMIESTNAGGEFRINTGRLPDGEHEVRLIAVENSPVQTRSYKKFIVDVNNRNHSILIENGTTSFPLGEQINLRGRIVGSPSQIKKIGLYQGSKLLTDVQVKDGLWQLEIPSSLLGIGSSSIQLRSDHPDFFVSSRLHPISVTPPVIILPVSSGFEGTPGFQMTVSDTSGRKKIFIQKTLNGKRNRKVSSPRSVVRYHGMFMIEQPGFYQLNLSGKTLYTVKLNDKTITPYTSSNKEHHIPLSLVRGVYSIELTSAAGAEFIPDLTISGVTAPSQFNHKFVHH